MKKIIYTAAILTLNFGLQTLNCSAQFTPIYGPSQTSPTSSDDLTFAIAVDPASGVFLAGDQNAIASKDWRIEKRSLTTGLLITTFGSPNGFVTSGLSNGRCTINALRVSGTSVYAVGKEIAVGPFDAGWRIEKRDLTNGSLTWPITENVTVGNDDVATAITSDGTAMYIAGSDRSGSDGEWRIEKRLLTSGVFTDFGSVTSNPSASDESAHAIAVDATGIYVAGSTKQAGADWRIEKRSLTTGALLTATFGSPNGYVTADQPGGVASLNAMAIDGTGIYLVGGAENVLSSTPWTVEKRNLGTGAIIWTQTVASICSGPAAYGIAIDATGIYVVGTSCAGPRRLEKRDLTTGDILCELDEASNTNQDDSRRIAVDASGVYVSEVCCDGAANKRDWTVIKYQLCTALLPIELLSFQGHCTEQNTVHVAWQTATETNNDYFTIERAAPSNSPKGGGLNWEVAGTVKGAGNSSTILNYEFIDNSPSLREGRDGLFYYRLSQTDFDGKTETFNSNQVAVDVTECAVKVFPNPAGNTLNIPYTAEQDGEITLQVYDVIGKLVKEKVAVAVKGNNKFTMDLTMVAQGMYVLRVKGGAKEQNQKFVKQ